MKITIWSHPKKGHTLCLFGDRRKTRKEAVETLGRDGNPKLLSGKERNVTHEWFTTNVGEGDGWE